MRKHATLSLASAGSNDKIEKGKIDLEVGKAMHGIRLKCSVTVANTTGGNVALTAAQRRTMLGLFDLTLKYGARGSHVPYAATTWARIAREQRYAYGSQMEGWADTSTGLATVITNASSATLVFFLCVPTGKMWWLDRDVWGMGRSQAKTVELELRRNSSNAIDTGLAVTGAVSVEVIPDVHSVKGDLWTPIPEYFEKNESDKFAQFPDGLPLRISERTAAHASSSLTNIDVDIDGEKIHSQMSAADLITEYNDAPTLPADASLTDLETLVLAYANNVRMVDLPSGAGKVTQNGTQQLATALYSYLFVPVKTEAELDEELQFAATSLRRKALRAVNAAAVHGWDIPDRLAFAQPFYLFDTDDREFEMFPGKFCEPGRKPDITIPHGVLERAKALHSHHKGKGENKAADSVVKQLAVAVPGAVQSGRGFSRNASTVFARVRAAFGS